MAQQNFIRSDISAPSLEGQMSRRSKPELRTLEHSLWLGFQIKIDHCPVTVIQTYSISVKAHSAFILPCSKVTRIHGFLTGSYVMSGPHSPDIGDTLR